MFGPKVFAAAAALLCAGLPAAASAQSDSAGVVTTVNGDATLIRAVAAARPVSLQMRDEIFVRDRIHTQQHSLVRVLLGGKALITVRELSILTVTEEAGRVTVDLESGKVGVAVVKGRMRPGEVIELRSPNATAAVRGTVFVVEVEPAKVGVASPIPTTRVHLFHGALDVGARLDPSQPAVRLAELQSVVVTGNTVGAVRPLSRAAVAALTADLKPRQLESKDAPDEFTSPLMAREQGRALTLAAALLATPAPAPGQGVVQNAGDAVTGLTETTAETLERLMDTLGLGDGLGNTLGSLGDTVGGFGGGVGGTVSGLGGAVGGFGSSVGGGVSVLGGGTSGSGGGFAPGGGLSGAASAVGGTVGGTVGAVGGTVGGLGGAVGGALGGLLGGSR